MRKQQQSTAAQGFTSGALQKRKTTVKTLWKSEVDLLPSTTSTDTTNRKYPDDIYVHCANPTKQLSNITQETISYQNLEFPIEAHDRINRELNVVHTKPKRNLLQPYTSVSSEESASRGYDFTSTTNSHFASMVFPVKQKVPKFKSLAKKTKLPSTKPTKTNSEIEGTIYTDTSRGIDPRFSKKPNDFNGPEWKKPCKSSFNAAQPNKYIGVCPHDYEKLSKFTPLRQKFFLTQDPRKVQCLVNPERLKVKENSAKENFEIATTMVKHAQNTCTTALSDTSESFICELIDLENPLNLDFQGMDYKNTYQIDEQEFQNQRTYRKVCRFLERKRVKADIATKVQEAQHSELVCVPERFEIRNRAVEPPIIPPEPPMKLGKLYRSGDKPCNLVETEKERELRFERYKDLYYRERERLRQRDLKTKSQQKYRNDHVGLVLAEERLDLSKNQIDECIKRTFTNELLLKKTDMQRRIFPHTMRETKVFKRYLKARNRLKRDEAIARMEFFKEYLNKNKQYPEANLEISSDSERRGPPSSHTEESTDDADNLEVGKEDNIFKLRGFHFFLGDSMRGKYTEREKHRRRREKGCMTREEWLNELAPKKEQVKVDIEMGIIKHLNPDDPNLVLFPPAYGYKVSSHKESAVREFKKKPLGRHYDRILRKRLKFAKPRLTYNVKKFNLIDYRFGSAAKRIGRMRDTIVGSTKSICLHDTVGYIRLKEESKRQEFTAKKQERLKLLGIPCVTIKHSRLQTKCENSETSSDSDWVPEHEADYDDQNEINAKNDINLANIVPLRERGNMPAPKFREPTLRQHPRRRRDYEKIRVPSEMFHKSVRDSNLPHVHKLSEDVLQYANVGLKKRPYTLMFAGRHHHDHWNPTHTNYVDVHYQPKVVKAQITQLKPKKRLLIEKFKTANPPCSKFVNMDLTVPNYDIEGMIKEYQEMVKAHKSLIENELEEKEEEQPQEECTQEKFILRSRDPNELAAVDYPGRKKYLQFLHDVKNALYNRKYGYGRGSNDYDQNLIFDRDAYYKELEEDLKSIESCLTSFSSSACTNFTNDSGSFLLMEGKEKVPLDYIRKSLVPFEELQRSRFTAEPIDVYKNEANPWMVMPFSGQRKAQEQVMTATDSFFTFNTRLKNGLRLRLEVPVEDKNTKKVGYRSNKHLCMVATDIDENYVCELIKRPPVKTFNFKSGRSLVKDALRLKFESLLIQGQIVRTKIYDRLNDQYWNDMQEVKILYDRLFSKWEKREYESSMAVVYKVKSYYDETDRLKNRFRYLERDMVILNMDIVFIEGHWIRCIMLQNFHYLMGDFQWRVRNDWIHGTLNEQTQYFELEDFEQSIQRRSFVNIRQREKDDAWAIKQFYEESYIPNQRPIMVVFPHADIFLSGIISLKSKTFVLLLELHFTMAIHSDLKYNLDTFEEWCRKDLSEKEAYVGRKCAKLYFMEARAEWLKNRTLVFMNDPIDISFNNDTFNRDRSSILEVWRHIVPSNMRVTNERNMKPVDMVAMIADVVMDLISKFEYIPMSISQVVEVEHRKERAYLRKQSHQAFQIERRIEMEMRKVVRNLQPPFVKQRRVGRLPRLIIKKRDKTVPPPKKKISERTKFFFRAFHEDGEVMQSSHIHEGLAQVDTMQEQIVPFYFDHFLKLNGYTPNYNFKTQVELRDGPEEDRIKISHLLPDILHRLENWEEKKKKIMEDHITQNPKMYIDVI